MKKLKAVILDNEVPEESHLWQKACSEFGESIEFRVVNLTRSDWFDRIKSEPFDILLAKPGGLTAPFKQLYDERLYILGKVMGWRIFPSVEEILIYENKRFLSYWLKANNVPHPETRVFYDHKEALDHIAQAVLPLVAKTNIGASGSGVRVLHTKNEAEKYVDRSFSEKGASSRKGPNLAKGGLMKRGFHYLLHPVDIRRKLHIYKTLRMNVQTGLVILQEFIPHEFEWRVVRIGHSFFAHKKLKTGGKASGSLLKEYGSVPLDLLDFVRELTDRHSFFSQAVDVFETKRGYLVNEMQCIFGQSDPHQMVIDGKPGRYLWQNGCWIFEEGEFNGNESYNLRVRFAIEMVNEGDNNV